jgi:hypothetical protein
MLKMIWGVLFSMDVEKGSNKTIQKGRGGLT